MDKNLSDEETDDFYDAKDDTYLTELSNECNIQPNQLDELRKAISPIEFDDLTLVRFLIANELSIPATAKRLIEHYKWLQKQKHLDPILFKPIDESGEIEILNGRDRSNYPIIFMRSRLHKTYALDGSYKDYMLYMIEKVLELGDRVSSVVDLSEVKWRNVDIPLILEALNLYNNHFPERLGNVVFTGGDFWFEYGFKLAKHLIGPRTVPRIHYAKTIDDIDSYIDYRILPIDCVLTKFTTF